MTILTAFRLHYTALLNKYTLEHDCTLEKSLKKLNKSLIIKRQGDGMYEVYDAYSSFICELEFNLLAAYVDHNSELPDIIKTNINYLLGRTVAEVVDPYPYLTAAQMLVTIEEFKQAVENEKVTYSAEIIAGTRRFAPNISATTLGWEVELTCEAYLYNTYIPGRGPVPVTWYVKPDEEIKQVLKDTNFTSGSIEEFRELIIVAARPTKLRVLQQVIAA